MLEACSGTLYLYEFLAEAGPDPRPAFIEHFLECTDSPGDILVYNHAFEITRLRELARDYPEYELEINSRIERIKDLMLPFCAKAYYTPGMRGSHSIKYVMPELVPELTYENLAVGDGDAAMRAFENMLSTGRGGVCM